MLIISTRRCPQCPVCGGPEEVPSHRSWGPTAGPVPGAVTGPQLPGQPGPGSAQQHDPPGGHQVPAPGVALLRDLVQ